jgi:ABC-2 type transport system ATP-binding protein
VADRLVIIAGGRIVASGTRAELLAGVGGTFVQATDGTALLAALDGAGLSAQSNGAAGAYIVDAEPERVGIAARDGGVALTRRGPADAAGLGELVFEQASGSDA